MPTLPDVGQVPVNPDAPGAPQQPGLPEFDPFATDPSTIPSPGVIEDPTQRPAVTMPPTQPDSPEGPGVEQDPLWWMPFAREKPPQLAPGETPPDIVEVEGVGPLDLRTLQSRIIGDRDGTDVGVWGDAGEGLRYDAARRLRPSRVFQELVTLVDGQFAFILPFDAGKNGELKFDGWFPDMNVIVDAKHIYDFIFDRNGEPYVTDFRGRVWQKDWPKTAQAQLDALAQAGMDAELVWVMLNEQYAELALRGFDDENVVGVTVETIAQWLERTGR